MKNRLLLQVFNSSYCNKSLSIDFKESMNKIIYNKFSKSNQK